MCTCCCYKLCWLPCLVYIHFILYTYTYTIHHMMMLKLHFHVYFVCKFALGSVYGSLLCRQRLSMFVCSMLLMYIWYLLAHVARCFYVFFLYTRFYLQGDFNHKYVFYNIILTIFCLRNLTMKYEYKILKLSAIKKKIRKKK